MAFLEYRFDARDYYAGVDDIQAIVKNANSAIVARIHSGVRNIITGVYYEAISQAGDGFPEIYQRHLLQGLIRTMDVNIATNALGFVATVGDMEDLGDYSDLEAGFHYHAIAALEDKKTFSVSNPKLIELPYTGQALYNDQDKREQFWEAIVNSEDVVIEFGDSKHRWQGTASTEGLYEETLRARVRLWQSMGVYPEWLILEYGTDSYPSVSPTHFSFLIRERIYEYLNNLYATLIDSIVDVWDKRPNTRINVGNKLIDTTTGRFVKYLPDDF